VPSSVAATRYGEPGLTRTGDDRAAEPERAAGERELFRGRRRAASPSSVSGFWSNEKMKYDFGLNSPSRLSAQGRGVERDPGAERSSLSTASRGDVREALHQRLDERRCGSRSRCPPARYRRRRMREGWGYAGEAMPTLTYTP
jgi:hypothetical protein